MTVETRIPTDRHPLIGIIALGYVYEHWDDLALEGEVMPLGLVDDLAAEIEAAMEDRAQEWLEKKPLYRGVQDDCAPELAEALRLYDSPLVEPVPPPRSPIRLVVQLALIAHVVSSLLLLSGAAP